MRTVDQFYEQHLIDLFDIISVKISNLEDKGDMDDQDEMELEALDQLLRDLEKL